MQSFPEKLNAHSKTLFQTTKEKKSTVEKNVIAILDKKCAGVDVFNTARPDRSATMNDARPPKKSHGNRAEL